MQLIVFTGVQASGKTTFYLRHFLPTHLRLSLDQLINQAENSWHGVKLHHPDWGNDSHSIALSALLRQDGLMVHLILNAYRDNLNFELPPRSAAEAPWQRWIDTALDSPHDIVPWEKAPDVPTHTYPAQSHSVVLLFARQ